ncbi:MAG: phosphate ABC transporter permease subunit PstC [Methanocellales archaeon]|nr:phosphate ABC transporter permease subunit PstC [Methanocellales archaeon]
MRNNLKKMAKDVERGMKGLSWRIGYIRLLERVGHINFQSGISHLFFLASVLLVATITIFFVVFILHTALPVFKSEGLINFITGTRWSYSEGVYGIRMFIIGTFMMTCVTLMLAVPVSIFTAMFLAGFAPTRIASALRPLIELLVGIPSVVYGILGFFVLEDVFQHHVDPFFCATLGSFIPFFRDVNPNSGSGILLAATVLAVMILPTITSISEDVMRSVPSKYREASFALGATRWETMKKVVLPLSSSGILTATILGMLRAMGEATAVVMLVGNAARVPASITDTAYPMTAKILNEIGYYVAMDEPRSALFGVAAVLFAIQFFFVCAMRLVGGSAPIKIFRGG